MVVALAGAMALLPAASAGAETFRVNTRTDHAPGACTQADCTLREAVRAANSAAGGDLIKLKGARKPYRLTRRGDEEDQAKKGDLDLGNEPLEIKGASASRSVIEQTERDRVIDVPGNSAAIVHLARLTITGGRAADGPGAGIHSRGLLFLDRVTVRGNESEFSGGGVGIDDTGPFTDTGQLTMSRSTVKGNSARLGGGGVNLNDVGLDVRIAGSTIAGNRASSGGGIAFSGTADATVINSTITANKAVLPDLANPLSTGGALSAYGDVTVVYSTITRNRAPAPADPGRSGRRASTPTWATRSRSRTRSWPTVAATPPTATARSNPTGTTSPTTRRTRARSRSFPTSPTRTRGCGGWPPTAGRPPPKRWRRDPTRSTRPPATRA